MTLQLQEFIEIDAPILKDTKINSGPEPRERPWTVRAQLRRLEETGVYDKASKRIPVENCGTVADAKMLMSIQDQSIAHKHNDLGTTVSHHQYMMKELQ